MHKPQIFTKALFGAAVLSLSFGTISCKQEAKPEDPKEVAEDENEAKFDDTKRMEEDAEILVDAAEFDLMERELGKLAQAKGVSTEVKDLAKMIEMHHNESFNELSTLAKSKGFSIPTALTEDGQKEYDRLNKVEAKNFDKEYLDRIYKDHHEALEDLTQYAQKTQDVEIKSYLDGELTALKNHHDAANDLMIKMNPKK
jgi:putative membrane protein